MLVIAAAWAGWAVLNLRTARAAASPSSPVDALQRDLLKQNLGKPGDAELDAMYQEIVTRHFENAMASIPVRWEPGLARVGPMVSRAFTLEGMFGHLGRESMILLNPDLAASPGALKRALCHEMVHAHLAANGDSSTEHGHAFQIVLQRLAVEGAFEGIPATEEERRALRAWLDKESARLDADQRDLRTTGDDIERERVAVEQDLAALDARVKAARDNKGPWPDEAEFAAAVARRNAYNQRATEANERAERGRTDLEHFNREVDRYNLMLVYPDGIDERELATPKPAKAE